MRSRLGTFSRGLPPSSASTHISEEGSFAIQRNWRGPGCTPPPRDAILGVGTLATL